MLSGVVRTVARSVGQRPEDGGGGRERAGEQEVKVSSGRPRRKCSKPGDHSAGNFVSRHHQLEHRVVFGQQRASRDADEAGLFSGASVCPWHTACESTCVQISSKRLDTNVRGLTDGVMRKKKTRYGIEARIRSSSHTASQAPAARAHHNHIERHACPIIATSIASYEAIDTPAKPSAMSPPSPRRRKGNEASSVRPKDAGPLGRRTNRSPTCRSPWAESSINSSAMAISCSKQTPLPRAQCSLWPFDCDCQLCRINGRQKRA